MKQWMIWLLLLALLGCGGNQNTSQGSAWDNGKWDQARWQ